MRIINILTYWIWELLKSHFFWMIHIFRGAIFFGLFPSTTALYAVSRKWIDGAESTVTFGMFKEFYQKDFKDSNILGWIALFISYIIYLNLRILPYMDGMIIKAILYGVIIFFLIIIGMFLLYFFPVLVMYSLPWYNYFLVSIHMGFVHFSYTILQIVLLGVYVLIIIHLFPLIFLFGLSVISVIQMYIFTYISKKSIIK